MIAAAMPHVYLLLAYGCATLWFVTPYFARRYCCPSWRSSFIDVRRAFASGRCRLIRTPKRNTGQNQGTRSN
jgi:hypothetical protein